MEGKELEERKQSLIDKLKARAVNIHPRVIDEVCVILVDGSGSMRDAVGRGDGRSKIDAVKLAIPHLRPVGVNVMFGLVVFENQASIYQQPTFQFGLLLSQVESILTGGQTNMTDGLRNGLKVINGMAASKKRMILLSDGCANAEVGGMDGVLSACQEAEVVVDTIAFGDAADRDRLRMIAKRTGGKFCEAGNVEQLEQTYRSLNYNVRYITHQI